MCISFFDVTTTRKEEIWVSTIALSNFGSRNSQWWASRLDAYADHLSSVYQAMDTAELVTHQHELEEAHAGDEHWAVVIDAVTAELKTRADTGKL